MKNKCFLFSTVVVLSLLFAGCGTYSGSDKAIVGGGAIAGKDYVCGLQPSDGARDYFNSISDDAPIETVRRTSENESKSGVKFVNNGGILIPPGVTISFDNQGYCMDPHLPASKDGEEFQLIPMSRLIPSELQGTYKNLIAQEAAGNSAVRSNMQHLVWALRTAGTDAAYANNLTPQQKQILNQCSDGLFELFHEKEKAGNKVINDLLGMADSVLNVSIGGVTYKASDLLDPNIANKKIEEHLNQLIDLSEYLPVENIGLNYGEIEPGIYTDVHGTGYLSYHARIANSTSRPFIFYPSDYVGQVGSPAKKSGLFAAADSSMRQRVTGMNQNEVKVEDAEEQNEQEKKSKSPYLDKVNRFLEDFPPINGEYLTFDGDIQIDKNLSTDGAYNRNTNTLYVRDEGILNTSKSKARTLYHELAHYYHNRLNKDTYITLSDLDHSKDVDRAIGEGFASIMSLKLTGEGFNLNVYSDTDNYGFKYRNYIQFFVKTAVNKVDNPEKKKIWEDLLNGFDKYSGVLDFFSYAWNEGIWHERDRTFKKIDAQDIVDVLLKK